MRRSRRSGKVGGVCAGIAESTDTPVLLVRIVALTALVLAPQLTILAYGVAYLVLDD